MVEPKQIIFKQINEIKEYENNPRKNDMAVDALANSIKEFGFNQPIVIDKNNVIVCGHTRLKASKKLGLKKVPCVKLDNLTDEQVKAYRLADNKTAELSDWDFSLLANELEELSDIDMNEFGFDIDALGRELDVFEDNFNEEIPDIPQAKIGNIYKLGRHRLMCGDSTKQRDVDALMNGQKADLFLTDPPYNVALGMGGSFDKVRKRHRRTDGLVIMNDKMKENEFIEFLKSAFTCAKLAMKPGASFYIWHADIQGYNFRNAVINSGFQLRQTLIWCKNAFTLGRQDYQWQHEPCLYGWNDGAGHVWYSDRKQSTIIYCDKPAKSKEHPTMKPVQLFDYQIKNSSKAGDIVLDLFGGSGTTIIACEQNGRAGYLMELDPRYVDVIIKRWENFTGKKAVLL